MALGRWDLSICGDYFRGSDGQTVETAAVSGMAAAAQILAGIHQQVSAPVEGNESSSK